MGEDNGDTVIVIAAVDYDGDDIVHCWRWCWFWWCCCCCHCCCLWWNVLEVGDDRSNDDDDKDNDAMDTVNAVVLVVAGAATAVDVKKEME